VPQHKKTLVGQKLNGTYQLLVYADEENLVGCNTDNAQKSTVTITDSSKKDGLHREN
jgi:hypothetical protein